MININTDLPAETYEQATISADVPQSKHKKQDYFSLGKPKTKVPAPSKRPFINKHLN